MPLYDFNCPKCGNEEYDIMTEPGNDTGVICEECGALMRKTPGIGYIRSEHPAYMQKEAMIALDPEDDPALYRKASRNHLTRDEWNARMDKEGWVRTEKADHEAARKQRRRLRQGKTREERKAINHKILRQVQADRAISVSGR